MVPVQHMNKLPCHGSLAGFLTQVTHEYKRYTLRTTRTGSTAFASPEGCIGCTLHTLVVQGTPSSPQAPTADQKSLLNTITTCRGQHAEVRHG